MKFDLGFEKSLRGKKIFVTGHTGFTGGWVCLWLKLIGAEIAGYSLEAETSPNLFHASGLDTDTQSTFNAPHYTQISPAL